MAVQLLRCPPGQTGPAKAIWRQFYHPDKGAWLSPSLVEPTIELILALYPVPERWGHWRAWGPILRGGADIAANVARPAQQGKLLAHLAELLWSCSLCEEAVKIGRRALNIAETLDAVRPLGIAGGALVKSLSAVGEVTEAKALLAPLLDQTAVLRPRSTQTDYATAMLILEHSQAFLLQQQGQAIIIVQRMVQRAEAEDRTSLADWQTYCRAVLA